tara:strand:+ start:1861 stop:2082 length:222 start_codon:yes stop_codon:yes gene_type:complete
LIVNAANKEFNFLNHGAPGGEWDMTIILLMIHIPLIVAAKFGEKNEKLRFGLITVYGIGMFIFLILLIFNAEI